MTISVPAHAVHLRLVQPVALDGEGGCGLFDRPEAEWLGSPVTPVRPDSRRFLTDLSLPVRENAPHLVFKKAAFVDLGRVRALPDGCEVEISWRSSTLAPLFPVFAGHLVVTSAEVRLEGFYAPPGGEVGMVLDRAFLNIAARGTARWLIGRVVEALARAGQDEDQQLEDATG